MPQYDQLISVIIPVSDGHFAVEETVSSVLGQDITDCDIIVVGDEANEELSEKIHSSSQDIQFIQKNCANMAAACNYALSMARGKFVVFLTSNSILLPGKLRQLAAFLELHREFGYVRSGWDLLDEDGGCSQSVQPWQIKPDLSLESWLEYRPAHLEAGILRRIWLDRIGGLDETIDHGFEVDLMLRLSLAGCVGGWLYESTVCSQQNILDSHRFDVEKYTDSVLAAYEKFFARPDLPAAILTQKTETDYHNTLWLAWNAIYGGNAEVAVTLLKQNLAWRDNDIADESAITAWFVHFDEWSREYGRSPLPFHTVQHIFQDVIQTNVDWPQLEQLANWLHTIMSKQVRRAYGPTALWHEFKQGLEWEISDGHVSVELALTWWALVWQPYLDRAFDTAVTGWESFQDLESAQLISLIRFGMATEAKKVSTALLNLLWSDARRAGLSAATQLDESALFAALPDLRRPKVSVLIPAYNSATYIAATIKSVLQQTYEDFEIIVVNDGSTDDTVNQLQQFRGLIRVVHQENQGVSAARNHGLRLALGEFVLFLDSDDVIKPDKLARQTAVLEADLTLGAVHSGWRMVDAYGRPIREITPWEQAPNLTLLEWLKWKPVFLGAILFRRQWLQRIEGFDTALRQAEDTDFLLRLSLDGCPMTWLPESTVDYRQHGASVTANGRQQAVDMNRVMDRFFQTPNLPDEISEMENRTRHFTLIWLVWQLFRTTSDQEIVDYLRQARSYVPEMPSAIIAQTWTVQFANYARTEGVFLDKLQALFPFVRQALAIDESDWPQLETMLKWWLTHWEMLHQGQLGDIPQVQTIVYAALHLEQEGHIRSSVEWVEWWLKVWRHFLPNKDCGLGHEMTAFTNKSVNEVVKLSQASILYAPERLKTWQIMKFWSLALDCGLIQLADKHNVTALYLTYFGQSLLGKEWRRALQGLGMAVRTSFHPAAIKAWREFVVLGVAYWRNGRKTN